MTATILGLDEIIIPMEWICLFQSIKPIDGYYSPEPTQYKHVSFRNHENPEAPGNDIHISKSQKLTIVEEGTKEDSVVACDEEEGKNKEVYLVTPLVQSEINVDPFYTLGKALIY